METIHFPSRPLPDPCKGCDGKLCAECARHGMTRVHFSADGICAYGHRLELPLADRLAEWIKAEGITAADSVEALAGRVIASLGSFNVTARLDSGNTAYLRDTAIAYADPRPLTDAEHAAELFFHGHDPY